MNVLKDKIVWERPRYFERYRQGFFVNAAVGKTDNVYFWITIDGSPDEANYFTYTAKIGKGFRKAVFQGPVLSMDDDMISLIRNKPVMNVKTSVIKAALDSNKYFYMSVEITMKNKV